MAKLEFPTAILKSRMSCSRAATLFSWATGRTKDLLQLGRPAPGTASPIASTRSGSTWASSTLQNPAWNNTTVIGTNLVAEIAALKQQPGKDIVQYGLGPVSLTLIDNGLIDEIRLWIHPIILGSEGPKRPHFFSWPPTRLRLVSTKTLPGGIAIVTYELKDSSED